MISDDEHFRLYGTDLRQVGVRWLEAGPVSVELRDGNLAEVRYRGHEILRGIAFLVRDKDWGTVQPELTPMAIETGAFGFRLGCTARYVAGDGVCLTADLRISGGADGRLCYAAEFSTDGDFRTARAGFVVLHPRGELPGTAILVEHGDGHRTEGVWPELIDPWRPFLDIRAITHRPVPGLAVEVRLDGDQFEMEDQRNWTDASYKTYVRSLDLPWPYVLAKGEVFRQEVTVSFRAGPLFAATIVPDILAFSLEETGKLMPGIGFGLRPECLADELAACDLAGRVAPAALVAHFDPLAGHGRAALAGYAEIGRRTGLPVTLEVALPCVEDVGSELARLAADCAGAGLAPETLFVSPAVDRQSTPPGSRWPDCPPLEEVYAAARAAFPAARLCGGMMSYFTELNRKPVPAALLDILSHASCPIVHAADDRSVMQTLEALGDVVRTVRAHYPAIAYRIGPSTIAMRQNPYGASTKPNPAGERIPMADSDPRHNARFGAAFALGLAAAVAPAGLELLTLSTLAGRFGLLAGDGEPTPSGALRPIGHVVARLARLSGQPVQRLLWPVPGRLAGLVAGSTLLLANLTETPVALALDARDISDIVSGERLVAVNGRLEVPAYSTLAAEAFCRV